MVINEKKNARMFYILYTLSFSFTLIMIVYTYVLHTSPSFIIPKLFIMIVAPHNPKQIPYFWVECFLLHST